MCINLRKDVLKESDIFTLELICVWDGTSSRRLGQPLRQILFWSIRKTVSGENGWNMYYSQEKLSAAIWTTWHWIFKYAKVATTCHFKRLSKENLSVWGLRYSMKVHFWLGLWKEFRSKQEVVAIAQPISVWKKFFLRHQWTKLSLNRCDNKW